MTIVLHIGAPKCGSTYLQRVLLKNQKTLRNMGVNYPHLGLGHPGNCAGIDQITRQWISEKATPYDHLILSHEDLFGVPLRARRFKNLTEKMGLELKIVAFVRPLDGWLAADYSQTILQTLSDASESPEATPDYEDFQAKRAQKLLPYTFLKDWQDLFPENELHVAPHTDIRTTFCNLVPPLRDIGWALPRWRTNPSMPISVAKQVASALRAGDKETAKRLFETRADFGAETPPPLKPNSVFQTERAGLADRFRVAI